MKVVWMIIVSRLFGHSYTLTFLSLVITNVSSVFGSTLYEAIKTIKWSWFHHHNESWLCNLGGCNLGRVQYINHHIPTTFVVLSLWIGVWLFDPGIGVKGANYSWSKGQGIEKSPVKRSRQFFLWSRSSLRSRVEPCSVYSSDPPLSVTDLQAGCIEGQSAYRTSLNRLRTVY